MNKQKKLSDNFYKIDPYVPGLQIEKPGVIKLNSNENPYPPSLRVREALSSFNPDDLRVYPPFGAGELIEALAGYHKLRQGQIFLGNGSDEVLALAFRAFFNGEDPILFPDIGYSFYPVWAALYGINTRTIPVDSKFELDVGDYNVANAGIVIANPNAPTGIDLGIAKIRKILENNSNSVVIIDEAYVDFGGESALPLIEEFDNLLVVQTMSKSRSLAGLRIGMCFGNKILIDQMEAIKNSFNSYPLDSLAQSLAIASLKDEAYFRHTCMKIVETRAKLHTKLDDLGFYSFDSSANFIFTRHKEIEASLIYQSLLAQDILVRHFDKPRIGEYLRISIGTDEQNLTLIEALERMI